MSTVPDADPRAYQRILIDQANAEMVRHRPRISRRALMRMTGIPKASMDRIFTCERDMSVAQWEMIATALGFDPGDLARKARESAGVTDRGAVPTSGGSHPLGGPPTGLDPRALITWLLSHPDQDEELDHRLSEIASRTGLSGRRLVTLQETIRTVRREELERALVALPPSTGEEAGRLSG